MSTTAGTATAGTGNKTGNRRRFIPYYVTDAKTNERINISREDAATINDWLALKAEEDALKERMEAMKPSIIAVVSETSGNVRYKGFTLKSIVRRSYNFTGKTADLKKQLDAAKKADIESGKAILKSETEYVEVKPVEDKPAEGK